MSNDRQGKTVIIVGGGMAGLTAAVYLAQSGWSVKLYEQHTLPGGYVSSFKRQGFTFPAGLTSICSSGMVFPILAELGLEGARTFVPVRRQLSWGDNDIPFDSPKQVRDQLTTLFPADRKGLRSYFALVTDGVAGSRVMEKSGVYMGASPVKLIAALLPLVVMHPRFLWLYLNGKKGTNRSLHTRYFRDQRLRSMLDQLGYPVMAAMNTMGMWNVYLNDYWAPLGGMQGLANKLVLAARHDGADIHLDTCVRRILVEGSSAAGVELADSTQERADKVISAVDLRQTCYELIGKEYFPASLIQKLETATPSETVFCVYLGLDEHCLEAKAFKRFLHSHVIYFSPSGEMIQLVWLNKDDPALAPPGKQTLYLACFSPYKQWAHWKGNHNAAYQACKEAEMQRLIRLAEEVIPNLPAHIEFKEAATPLTFERYTGNWQGASVGWNWDPALNPNIDFANELKLGNFYQIGHWRFIPGALPSAMITARYIAQDILKTE